MKKRCVPFPVFAADLVPDLLYPAQDARAAQGRAARALAASFPGPKPWRAWAVRSGEGEWAGDTEAGAMLFADGTALLGVWDSPHCLHTAPLVWAWRGPQGPHPSQWPDQHRSARDARIARQAYHTLLPHLWRPVAPAHTTWRSLATGRLALAPWAATAVRRCPTECAPLGALLWVAAEASQSTGALYGSCLHGGALVPPTLVWDGLSSGQRCALGAAVDRALTLHLGPQALWKTVCQHHAGRPGVIATPTPPHSAHQGAQWLATHRDLWTALRAS